MRLLIAFEGLEGVGKTTLGLRTAERLDLAYVKSPPPLLNPVRGYVASVAEPRCGFYFYLAGLYALQEDLRSALSSRRGVIVDRYLLSTIAYWDAGQSFDPPAHDASGLLMPELTLRITCDEESRRARVADRGFHIYDRVRVEEDRIDAFMASRSDFDFRNEGPLDASVERLCALLDFRLREDKQALAQDARHQPSPQRDLPNVFSA